MNVIELIIYIAVSLTIGALVYFVILLGYKNHKYLAEATQAQMDRILAIVELEKLLEEKDSASIESTEGFLKFISESREWAFKYIEDVQDAISEYDNALNTDDAKIINEAYKKLISLLPDDDVVK